MLYIDFVFHKTRDFFLNKNKIILYTLFCGMLLLMWFLIGSFYFFATKSNTVINILIHISLCIGAFIFKKIYPEVGLLDLKVGTLKLSVKILRLLA